MIYEENKILVNDFNYFFCNTSPGFEKLEVYLNGEKLVEFGINFEEITSFTKYFSRGKYFLFVLLNKTTGLKILRPLTDRNQYEEIKKIIKIQKILYKNGVSFDCEDTVLEIPIRDAASNTQRIFMGYITNTDINFECPKQEYDLIDIDSILTNIFKENHITRCQLRYELRKPQNYVLTNENKYNFIDIDPRFYFEAQTKQSLKDEIIREGQFPYKRRKYQYQSIEEENMVGIRDMEHRYSILNLPTNFSNKTVLDLGCSLGMVCIMAKLRNADFCVGLDNNESTIDVARRYIEEKKYEDIKLFVYDINNGIDGLISLIGPQKFDYVFVLSIMKHVNPKPLFEIINFYTKDVCWFEGHNKQNEIKIEELLTKNLAFKKIEFLGHTTDRGTRPNFKIAM